MYCKNCRTRVLLQCSFSANMEYAETLDIKDIVIIPTTILSSNVQKITITGFVCPECGNVYPISSESFDNLITLSSITGVTSLRDAVILIEKAPDEEIIDNKVKLIRPPMIVSKDSVDQYISAKSMNRKLCSTNKVRNIRIETQ